MLQAYLNLWFKCLWVGGKSLNVCEFKCLWVGGKSLNVCEFKCLWVGGKSLNVASIFKPSV